MNLRNDRELATTRKKLARLQARYEALQREQSEDELLREATLRSLRRYINQFTEEIVRYEARVSSGRVPAPTE